VFHGFASLRQALLGCDPELVPQVNVRGREENVDARSRSALQCLPGAIDVAFTGASQAGDDRPPNGSGDLLHRFEVAIGGNWEPRFDHVHAEPVQLLGQAQLFTDIHTAARRLLAIAKRSVEYSDPRSIHEEGSSGEDCFCSLSAGSIQRKGYYLYRSISRIDSIRIAY
jgi:hypothetical protein